MSSTIPMGLGRVSTCTSNVRIDGSGRVVASLVVGNPYLGTSGCPSYDQSLAQTWFAGAASASPI